MKRTAVSLAVAMMLSGCAGLNVSWDFQARYNREVSPVNIDIRMPRAEEKPKGSGV